MGDNVNHPDHYTAGGVECLDAIEAALGPEGFAAYIRGNCIKYLWRAPHKGGLEDLRKARWYLTRLIGDGERSSGVAEQCFSGGACACRELSPYESAAEVGAPEETCDETIDTGPGVCGRASGCGGV